MIRKMIEEIVGEVDQKGLYTIGEVASGNGRE